MNVYCGNFINKSKISWDRIVYSYVMKCGFPYESVYVSQNKEAVGLFSLRFCLSNTRLPCICSVIIPYDSDLEKLWNNVLQFY